MPPSDIASDSDPGASYEYRDDATSTSGAEARNPLLELESQEDPRPPAWLSTTRSQLLKYTPEWAQRTWLGVVQWVKGPQPPRPYSIRPFYPEIQTAPLKILDRFLPKKEQKIWLLVGFYFCWVISFVLVLQQSAFSAEIKGYGAPVTLSCGARYWADGTGCGLNGDLCRPFANQTLPFRCPANCKRVQALNPHAVGNQEVVYRPLVVGGPTDTEDGLLNTIYRADSFICGSAIHAGFISDREGGCGVLSLVGERQRYPSTKGHGITSIEFDSYFPKSFSFVEGTRSQCRDLRWPLLAVSLTFMVLLSLFTTSPSIFFVSIFIGMFFHVGLASDPPNLADYYSIISIILGRFLPAAFVAFVIYRYCVRRTLTGLTAQVEKTVLWLGAAWVGALNNYTFDKIPIQRLTPHDLQQQPGAVPALIAVVLTIFFIALGQAYAFRVEGRMPRYLALYGFMSACLLLLVAVPKMNVRIHHYILALLLLPGTSMQTRPALLYQGLLVGLFINGIARWGFDSILQTPAELLGDGQIGSKLPMVLEPIIGVGAANITFSWELFPKTWDGISILVNDVERFRGYLDRGTAQSWTWTRAVEGLPEYFRFALVNGNKVGDFTKAGTWLPDGTWVHMDPGASFQ